ncbi:hypothetical protein QLX08_004962 [Tetragonisca angustula]|uniref:Uncharacterized protein n=1 Tax=Tetragonisca angustula TaxID=166442 RepID=A0AAW0ZZG2_9HYME
MEGFAASVALKETETVEGTGTQQKEEQRPRFNSSRTSSEILDVAQMETKCWFVTECCIGGHLIPNTVCKTSGDHTMYKDSLELKLSEKHFQNSVVSGFTGKRILFNTSKDSFPCFYLHWKQSVQKHAQRN